MVQSRMATIKLKTPSSSSGTARKTAGRPPVRGSGSAPRKRPTLAEAQAERAERDAAAKKAAPWRDDREPRRAPNAPRPQDPRRAPASSRPDDPRRAPASARPEDPRRHAAPKRPPLPPARPAAPRPDRPSGPNTAFTPNKAFDSRKPSAPPRPQRPMHEEEDDAPGSMRLSKRMSELGIASRREADEWIAKGWVRVDGRVVSELGSRVTPDQHITIDAKAKSQQAQKVTVLLNKPVGYVSGQAEDGYEPAVVLVTPQNQWREDRSGIQFLPHHTKSLAPAGRLDIDSVGLLVLTQDGRIAKQLIGEESDTEKEYLVRVQSENGQPLADDQLALLNHGLELDGEPLLPAKVEWVNEDQLRFVLKEGKKRQIRRMCEAVGLKVLGLKRVRIGGVMLGDLPPGKWRYLRVDERF